MANGRYLPPYSGIHQFEPGIVREEPIGEAKARIAYEHMHGNPAINRMMAGTDNPFIFPEGHREAGSTGTHYMNSQGNYAVPGIQEQNGQLVLNENFGPNSDEAIRFDNPSTAQWFAENNYKKLASGMDYEDVELTDEEIEEYKRGGYVVEELPKAQKGSIKFTDDKQKVRMYNDSLSNFTDGAERWAKTIENDISYRDLVKNNDYYIEQGINGGKDDNYAGFRGYRDTLMESGDPVAIPVYKEPVQPYKYKKSIKPIEKIKPISQDFFSYTSPKLNTTPREGIPSLPTPTIIGYGYDEEGKRVPHYQIISEPDANRYRQTGGYVVEMQDGGALRTDSLNNYNASMLDFESIQARDINGPFNYIDIIKQAGYTADPYIPTTEGDRRTGRIGFYETMIEDGKDNWIPVTTDVHEKPKDVSRKQERIEKVKPISQNFYADIPSKLNTTLKEGIPPLPTPTITNYGYDADRNIVPQFQVIPEPSATRYPNPYHKQSGGAYEDMELDDERIEQMRAQGYRVDVL
jgi:hypothetical protein